MSTTGTQDPYQTLGVQRTATADEIRSAYRKLAKKYHPDLNPGNSAAEQQFKSIASAYGLLSDAAQRKRFDAGEIDADGAERAPAWAGAGTGAGGAGGTASGERRYYRDYADQAARNKYRAEPAFDDEFLHNLFAETVGERSGDGYSRREFHMPGRDVQYSLPVDFLTAATGATRRLTLAEGRVLDVTIPPGTADGQVLRLKGQGMPGIGDGPPGDALIEITVTPHKLFRREGNDIVLELPVTLKEAVLGAKVEVPTIKGPVSLAIPPHASTGTRLRLKGRGIGDGHQYVVLKVVLPPGSEPELEDFLKGWTPRETIDPRRDLDDK